MLSGPSSRQSYTLLKCQLTQPSCHSYLRMEVLDKIQHYSNFFLTCQNPEQALIYVSTQTLWIGSRFPWEPKEVKVDVEDFKDREGGSGERETT